MVRGFNLNETNQNVQLNSLSPTVQPGKLSLPKHACPPTPMDLNLFPAAAASPCAGSSTATYHSVCTIEKVKTALERFERGNKHHHHSHSGAGASPSSSSVTTSSVKRRGGVDGAVEQGDGCDSPSGGGMAAAACPRCFLYVLVSRGDPRCPRCEAHVPAPAQAVIKKPRIDLNVGYLGT
jgi:hypothetical protein